MYYEAILVCFALIGWAQFRAARVGRSRFELFLLICDLTLLTFTALVPNPFFDQNWPTAMQYRFDNFNYFYVLLAGATLAYSWRTIMMLGNMTALLWAGGLVAMLLFGYELPELGAKLEMLVADYPRMFGVINPSDVGLGLRVQEIVVFLIVAAILALNGWRNNQLLLKQANVARERENLARHFPPNIVDQMANQDEPLGQIRAQPVAVMFADIVGFTRLVETSSPKQVVKLLREFHRRMELAVFDNQGTLDKFLGDGIMASFGTPDTSQDDAGNALCCARDMLQSIDQWNLEKAKLNEPPVELSVGIHYGEVILGDIGSSRRLEFAILGDTVNVASRLEELTRQLGTRMVVSQQLIKAVNSSSENGACEFASDLKLGGQQVLRGREGKIEIWTH